MKENTARDMENISEEEQKRRRGNPQWSRGMPSPNSLGRPKVLNKEKKTNRELRGEELMNFVRKLKPHQTKAIQAAVGILDNKEASENGKLRASAMILQLYKDLVKDLYDFRYDDEGAEEIQQKNAPVFSLKMLNSDDKEVK